MQQVLYGIGCLILSRQDRWFVRFHVERLRVLDFLLRAVEPGHRRSIAVAGQPRVAGTESCDAELGVRLDGADGAGVGQYGFAAAQVAAAALPARAGSSKAGGTMLIDVGKGRRWSVAVSPLMPSARLFDLADRRLAMIVVSEIVVRAPLEEQLRQAFALTMAEARLARRVIAGVTLEEIASELDVKISTLRTQLKSVFAKTETKRQGELMQLGARLDRLREV